MSHSYNLTVLLSIYKDFEIKSIPTVGLLLFNTIIKMNTYSFPVKLSKINLFMIDVLPTDWSPKKTILNFCIGPELELDAILINFILKI